MADPTYTITWDFQGKNPLERIVGGSDDGLVTAVHWNLTCVSSDGFTGYDYGMESFEKGSSVTPFADLTKTQVTDWIKTRFGSEECTKKETAVKQQCIDQRTPASKADAPTSWSS